jgi:hypothetical protein
MQEIYDLHGYLAEMREAMEKWEAYVLTHHFQLPPDYRELNLALTFRS